MKEEKHLIARFVITFAHKNQTGSVHEECINHSIITKYISFAKKCGNIPLLSYPDVRGKLMFGYYVSL